MKRYFIYLAYKGSNYCGWQIQPNGISVQEVLEKALAVVFRTPIPVVAAGRTDAGVHAKLMVAHMDAPAITDTLKLSARLNSLLPADIAIYHLKEVMPHAHARFDATARRYEYWMVDHKSPFNTQTAAYIRGSFDIDKMNAAAQELLRYTDFTSFSKLHTDVKTNHCQVYYARWEKRQEFWVFTIEANRFLRNMVRAIVGTLLEVGRNKITKEGFCQIIEAKNRCRAGASVDADGLYLVDVKYPETLFLKQP